eukprot:UN11128
MTESVAEESHDATTPDRTSPRILFPRNLT